MLGDQGYLKEDGQEMALISRMSGTPYGRRYSTESRMKALEGHQVGRWESPPFLVILLHSGPRRAISGGIALSGSIWVENKWRRSSHKTLWLKSFHSDPSISSPPAKGYREFGKSSGRSKEFSSIFQKNFELHDGQNMEL